MKEDNSVWCKKAINDYVKRIPRWERAWDIETLANEMFIARVVVTEGICSDPKGWLAHCGLFMALNVYSRQHDTELFSGPDNYNAFIFSPPYK